MIEPRSWFQKLPVSLNLAAIKGGLGSRCVLGMRFGIKSHQFLLLLSHKILTFTVKYLLGTWDLSKSQANALSGSENALLQVSEVCSWSLWEMGLAAFPLL